MTNLVPSIIRTVAAVVVGALATAALRLGVTLDTTAALAVVQPIVTSVVYAVIRWLEVKVSPAWGWALGLARPPAYPDRHGGITVPVDRDGQGPTGYRVHP